MTELHTTTKSCSTRSPRRRWARRGLLALALILGAGGVAYAAGPGHARWKHPETADEARAHMGQVAGFVLDKVEATDPQRARVDRVLDNTAPAMWNLRGEAHDLHGEIRDLLTADTIDRAALEEARQDGLQLADRGSKLVLGAIADVAETLTPAQRRQIAEAISKHHR